MGRGVIQTPRVYFISDYLYKIYLAAYELLYDPGLASPLPGQKNGLTRPTPLPVPSPKMQVPPCRSGYISDYHFAVQLNHLNYTRRLIIFSSCFSKVIIGFIGFIPT